MNKTKIDWCDSTWNPVTGCLHECEYCYARGISKRFGGYWDENKLRHFGANGNIHVLEEPMYKHTTGKNRNFPVHDIQAPYPYGFDPTLHRYRLDDYKDKKGRNIFVCSMSDLFGAWVPDSWIDEVFAACEAAPQHNYIFLTKNPRRYERVCDGYMPPNMWFGWSQTGPSEKGFSFTTHHSVKTFISIEPLLTPFNDLNINGVEWVIIGAETGRRKNKVVPERKWIEYIVSGCRQHGIPVFMKSSLADVWGEPLIQEFPKEMIR